MSQKHCFSITKATFLHHKSYAFEREDKYCCSQSTLSSDDRSYWKHHPNERERFFTSFLQAHFTSTQPTHSPPLSIIKTKYLNQKNTKESLFAPLFCYAKRLSFYILYYSIIEYFSLGWFLTAWYRIWLYCILGFQ